MSEVLLAPWRAWLASPLSRDVAEAIDRLRQAPDVRRVAVMPDVHLGADVCVGVAMATVDAIYPQAVGGDIGCGMLAVGFDGDAEALDDPGTAARTLAAIGVAVPARRRNRAATVAQPAALASAALSGPGLDAARRRDGVLEFATLGSGNHFIELQVDAEERLWLMIHSGSRAVGPAIRDAHLAGAMPAGQGLRVLDGATDAGAAYLHDVEWARRYADASRRAMADAVDKAIAPLVGGRLVWATAIASDHNHVVREHHGGRLCLVHRKGAMPAGPGVAGVVPGSMGTASVHVEGRGHPESLESSAHGAGRILSRSAARSRIGERELRRQLAGVWFDVRLAGHLRDEAPAAYKDIHAVLRAQDDLVTVTRVLRPLLTYKGL
jgi:tRNA-splicing ligase RtcB (3'-phosphate/5'-hydroxy nucleic acid ligase)